MAIWEELLIKMVKSKNVVEGTRGAAQKLSAYLECRLMKEKINKGGKNKQGEGK